MITYVKETPGKLRAAAAAPPRPRVFVAESPLGVDESSSDEGSFMGMELNPRRRGSSDCPPTRSTRQRVGAAEQAAVAAAWQGAGLHTREVRVLQQFSDHPLLFERRCPPMQPADPAWMPGAAQSPVDLPFHSYPTRVAAKKTAAMATAFSAPGGLFQENGVPVPIFYPVEGSPSAANIDNKGPSYCKGGAWRNVIFDERHRAIQWPWERGAPVPDKIDLTPTEDNPDPVSAYFVDTVSSTTAGTHALDATVDEGLRNATAKGDGGANSTGTRGWQSFCRQHRRSPDRPIDPLSPLAVKLEEEQWCMRFVAHLIDSRDIAVDTAKGYWHAASGWHQRKHGVGFAGGLDMKRIGEMIKGLKRVRDKPHEAKVRRGVAPQKLRQALDKLFPRNTTKENANVRAMVASAFQGLLRGREVCKADGKAWDASLDLARGDIAAVMEDRIVYFIRPAKNMKYTKGKTVPIVIGAGGKYIDAHAEIMEMLRIDPVDRGHAAATPMFRHANGAAFSVAELRDIVKALMRSVGEPAEEFGAHSLRIGGATALFAAGADPIHIRTMGRWSSDCYRLYVRSCFEQTLAWTAKIGSQDVHDVQGTYARQAQETECY